MLLSQLIERDNNAFGVIRLIAACLVVFDHMFMLTAGNGAGWPFAGTASTLGQHAVHVFFVLSGILVAASLDRSRTVYHFAASRALRILPGLVVCVLVTAFVVGPMFTSRGLSEYFSSFGTVEYLLRTLSLSTGMAPLPGVFADHPLPGRVNVPIWTIKYEVLCYIALGVVAATGLWWQRRLRGWLGLSLFAALAAVILFPGKIIPPGKLVWLVDLSLAFLTGVAAYNFRNVLRITGLGLLVIGAAYIAAMGSPFERLLAPAAVGYLALLVAQMPFGALKEFTDEIDLSYGVYIYGWVIQQIVIALSPGISAQTALLFVAPMVLAVATLSWFLVEKPALDLKKPVERWLDGKLMPTGPASPRFVRAGGQLLSVATDIRQGRAYPSVQPALKATSVAFHASSGQKSPRRAVRLR